MYIKDIRDALSSLLCLLAGSGVVVASSRYDLGTAFSMGPGYFPLILGILLLVMGLFIGLGSVSWAGASETKSANVDLRSLWAVAVVAAAFVGFALALETFGLALTCFSVLAIAGMTSHLLRPLEALLTAFVLCIISVILFVYLLDLQIRAWPW
jgi:hypothetical protein